MKILINAYSARLGGGQTYLKNLLANIPQSLKANILIYAPVSLALPDDHRITRCRTRWPTENPILRTIWEKLVLPRILKKYSVDILFCPGGVVSTVAPPSCQTVTMFRNMLPFDPQAIARLPMGLQKIRNYILKPVMLRGMRDADLTIFISKYARSVIEEITTVKNAITIPHGINPSFTTEGKILPRPRWLPDGEYLLYVSRFDVYKHQYEVATAYAALPEKLKNRYKLVFVGEADNALAAEVKQFIASENLQKKIIITGAIPYDDLPNAYRHASINLFASSCENCPNILLEALAAARPILSSDVMPMPEFAADAAAYFSPTDATSLQKALSSVLQNNNEMKRLSSASLKRSKHYNWEKTATETWEALAALVKR